MTTLQQHEAYSFELTLAWATKRKSALDIVSHCRSSTVVATHWSHHQSTRTHRSYYRTHAEVGIKVVKLVWVVANVKVLELKQSSSLKSLSRYQTRRSFRLTLIARAGQWKRTETCEVHRQSSSDCWSRCQGTGTRKSQRQSKTAPTEVGVESSSKQ